MQTTQIFTKKISYTLFLASFVVLNSFIIPRFLEKNTPPQYPACKNVQNTVFQGQEELVYKIYYNLNKVWVAAGEVTFRTAEDGNKYHFSATGVTYSNYEWFYKVRDYYNTWADKNSLLPIVSERSVSENKYQLYDKVWYDQNKRKASFLRGQTKDKADTPGNVTLTDCTHDVLSIIYYCRTLDYSKAAVGTEYPAKFMLDEQIYDLKYKFLGRENKAIREQGTWKVMKFSPQLVAGNVFKENAQMYIWGSDDENKIPVMIESPIAVGSVKVVLKSWKGLKYPVTAKLN